MINKFISIASFSIAIVSLAFQYTQNPYILSVIFIGTSVILWLFSTFEERIGNSKGAFWDKFFYLIAERSSDYIVEYAETCYTYLNKDEMTYSKYLELKSHINGLKTYEDKFCWSAYNGSITIHPQFDAHSINIEASKNLWTVFEVNFNQRYKKGDHIKTGYKVDGLKDELGIAKPFLSHRSDEVIKERTMIVKIPKELKPVNAKFEIYKTSETGKIISSEPLEYNEKIKGFSKNISYLRKGWTYAIVWDWDE